MTEKKAVRTGILPSDMDAQGNVTLWDHGPQEPHPDVERDSEEYKRLEAEAKAWHALHGEPSVPVVMHASDAGHAMMIEPERYALEPLDLDEDEIARRVQEKKAKREAARDFEQNVIDRREAIAEMMSDRAHQRMVENADPGPEPVAEPEPVVKDVPKDEVKA